MSIQKYHLIDFLNQLIANHFLYKNIEINYRLLDIQKNKFILFDITINIVYCNPNHYKHISYTVNLYYNNYKNNHDATNTDTSIKKDYIYINYVYSNINNKRQNLTL